MLFTKESKAEYTISFNSDGGSTVTSITAFEGEIVKLPENPTKEGYKFLYWADETEKPISGEVIMKRNLSLLAMWTEEDKEVVTVTFDTDGGTVIEPIVLEKGEKLVLPNNPIKEDCEFKEWVNSNNEKIVNEFFVEENITLKATWTKKEAKKTIGVEQKLSVWTNSGNTITFSREENGRTYYTFKGEKVLDFGSNIDVTWEGFNSNSPVIAHVMQTTREI